MSVGARFLARDGFSAHGEVRLASCASRGTSTSATRSSATPTGSPCSPTACRRAARWGCRAVSGPGERIRLSRARIDGGIFLERACLDNPAGDAIRCRNTQAQTLYLGAGLTADGIVDFRNSHSATSRRGHGLAATAEALRSQLRRAGAAAPAALRVAWLRRDVDGYLPRNYETLAAMYRNSGDDAGARQVLLARERERRAHLPGTGERGHGCRRSPSGTGTGRCARPAGCWRSSRPARWPSACTTRRRWPAFRIPPSTRSSTRLT